MARGGLNKTKANPAPKPLTRWPPAPESFTDSEEKAWEELGAALMALGTASRADLILVRVTARTLSRLDDAFESEGDLPITAINALSRLVSDLLNRLGLSPQARSTVSALPKPKKAHDPMAEFEG